MIGEQVEIRSRGRFARIGDLISVGVFIVFGVFIAVKVGLGYSFPFLDEDMHVTYTNYEAMVADGAVMRGWVPEFVPKSATDFEESHNLDTNRSWLRFTVPAGDIEAMTQGLVPVSVEMVQFPKQPPALAEPWWPDDLTDPPSGRAEYNFYQHHEVYYGGRENRTNFLAVDRVSNTVWYWRPSGG